MKEISKLGMLIVEEILNEPGIAIYPGAFKPPHKSHFETVKRVSEKPYIKQVLVIISDTDRDGITADNSLHIWNTFLKAEPNPKVKVIKSSTNSPIKDIYSYLQKNMSKDEPVYIIGNKDESDDQEYFNSLRKSFGDKVQPLADEQKEEGITSSVVRDILRSGDYREFKKVMPDGVQNKGYVESIFKSLGGIVQQRDLSENKVPEEDIEKIKEQGYNVIKKSENKKTIDNLTFEIKKFFDWCCFVLDIKEKPTLNPITDVNYAIENKSFGGYEPTGKVIHVVLPTRNLIDVLRTVSHEIVHHKQNELGMLKSNEDGDTGSEVENEANALAGVIMREYGKRNQHLYTYNIE